MKTKIGEVENKIPNTSALVTTTVLYTKISEFEKKIPNCDKYITTPEFNKLTAENFTARLKQANLVTKTDFDKKLTSFKGTIMQTWKSPHMFRFIQKYYPEDFAFLILEILKLHIRKDCEMLVYKHVKTIKYVKN